MRFENPLVQIMALARTPGGDPNSYTPLWTLASKDDLLNRPIYNEYVNTAPWWTWALTLAIAAVAAAWWWWQSRKQENKPSS